MRERRRRNKGEGEGTFVFSLRERGRHGLKANEFIEGKREPLVRMSWFVLTGHVG